MPNFPQYQNAALVTYSNYRPFVLSGSAGATIAANAGDVILVQVNAINVSGVAAVRLPPVALGGPVLVKFTSTVTNTFGTAATVTVAPALADVQASTEVTIDGRNAITLNNLGDEAVFASDGSNWWIIDKSHNTHDTY